MDKNKSKQEIRKETVYRIMYLQFGEVKRTEVNDLAMYLCQQSVSDIPSCWRAFWRVSSERVGAVSDWEVQELAYALHAIRLFVSQDMEISFSGVLVPSCMFVPDINGKLWASMDFS